jgi:hypothetical protein
LEADSYGFLVVGNGLVLSKLVMGFGYGLISIEKTQQYPELITDNKLRTQNPLLKT